MEPDTRSYYERNKERMKKMAREYHYKRKEHYNAYSKAYYEKNKALLNEKRRLRKQGTKRVRASLVVENKTPELEARRKAYQAISLRPLTVIEPPPPPVIVHTEADFTVKFL